MIETRMRSTGAMSRSQRDISNKENDHGVRPGKKRKLASKEEDVKASSREALSMVNISRESIASIQQFSAQPMPLASSRHAEFEGVRMASEEVEALLNMKMTGKSKFDLKGRNDQMMEYIKNLRTCVRQFLQMESAYALQIEQLQGQVNDEKKNHSETETRLKNKQDELETKICELSKRCQELQELSMKNEAEKKELTLGREKDAELLRAANNEQNKLLEEIEKCKKEAANANVQVGSLQDINRRLQEYNTSLQHYNSKLQSDAAQAIEENSRTQKEKAAIIETLGNLRGSNAALQAQLDTAKASLQAEVSKAASINEEIMRVRAELQYAVEERDKNAAQVQTLSSENALIRDLTGKSAAEIEVVTSKAIALEESYERQNEQIKFLRQQLDRSNQMLEIAESSLSLQKKEGAESFLKVEQLQNRIAEAEQQLRDGEQLRRKLHNTIQELKGNIRVFCRVRPFLPDDEETSPVVNYPVSDDVYGQGIELFQPQGQKYMFSFDKVFAPDVSQQDVFVEISQLVQSALDGYKVCIFAYGQTGSGKTHTMIGQPDNSEQKGVIPRSLEQIFESSQALRSQGWTFKMQASMLEIYNETIRDLLNSKPELTAAGTPAKQHVVKHEPNGNTVVSDLTVLEVTNWQEVSSLLRQAAQSRTVGKTAMNDRSSRSHCVFTMRITGTNENTEQQVHGVLNLIDLAGSERLSRSGATGERLKETQAINKSLSSLGDVISAIGNKEQHIPYRNSKLTYLLQPCLGGDSKTLMFVNVSPDVKSLNESLCSLRFAAKVNACEIGIPRRHTNSKAISATS